MGPASVIVPARDAAGTLGVTLDALAGQGAEVIVVDDGSSDGTADLAERHPVVARVVRVSDAGPGAARNAGAAVATAPVLAFTDADCVPAPGWLAAGLRALEDADLVQGRVDPDPCATRHPFERTVSVTAAWGLFESANLFVRRDLFERLGGFPDGVAAPAESFLGVTVGSKHLGEDVAFGWLARRAGARTAFADEAVVHHAVFNRTPAAFVAERKRLRHFPEIARRSPELRETFFTNRVFLTRQTRAFDAALAGAALAAVSRSPRPLVLALPYARRLYRFARRWPQHPSWRLVATTLAADVVGAASLARGSIEHGTPVL